MSTCPYCQAAVPHDALCCVHCGRTLVTETVQDRSTQERLRELLEAKGILVGGMTPPPPSPTLIEGPPPGVSPVLRSGEAGSQILSLRTDQEQSLFALPFEETMSPAPAPTLDEREPTPQPSVLPAPTPPPVGVPAAQGHPDRMPQAGDVIEPYEIASEIGRGGMGRVYLAHHRLTGQEVALKMLLPQFSNEPRLRARFLNEAKVLARLEHPNLVPLLGFFESGNRAFIVMPYVRGITLERMLRRQGRLAVEIVVDLFEQLCAAIEHVHRHDFLHRDLKPSNVIVRGDGRVMVTDFGIARAVGGEKMTLPGMVVGTAEYLAPEQACGASRDDKRSDIYSLGILLYEMLTGQVPFHHPNAGEVLQRQVSSPPPPPRAIVPEITPALESVMLRALAKDPDKRFQSAQEFANVVRTTVWPMPGTVDVARHEVRGQASPAPVSGRGSGLSAPGAGIDRQVAPIEFAPTLDAPGAGRAAAPSLKEWLRWGAVVLGLAGVGAAVGAWLRLRG
ncbi:protein kinase [Myxococcota bacterium]|nr:protein kinase [Myxococcota bacterium]